MLLFSCSTVSFSIGLERLSLRCSTAKQFLFHILDSSLRLGLSLFFHVASHFKGTPMKFTKFFTFFFFKRLFYLQFCNRYFFLFSVVFVNYSHQSLLNYTGWLRSYKCLKLSYTLLQGVFFFLWKFRMGGLEGQIVFPRESNCKGLVSILSS